MIKIDTSKMDYLKAIYACMENEGYAVNKTLTDRLSVSPASVTEMIKKLVELGDVYLEKKCIYLSKQGMEEVKKILTKHRLWEIFLVEYMGYSWHEVHEEADALEHATSDRLKDSLNAFLNKPKHCPHGSEIFENHTHQDKLRRMDSLVAGDVAYIHRVVDDKALLEYLEIRGLKLNQEIKVLSVDSYDGSLSIESEGREVNVAAIAASKIMLMMQ